jgi:hypothetical protein
VVRWVFVLATSLVMLACAQNKPSPQPSRVATNTAPAPPRPALPAPPPEQAPPCDDALVKRVAAGAAPLGELWTRHCADVDKARAILTARTQPSLTGFVTAQRRATAVAPSEFADGSSTRVSWQGTCVASVDETLPPSNGFVPTECLSDAEVSEQKLPTELNDVRAEFLLNDPAALRRWRSCQAQTPAETCLERLLPSTGGELDRDPGRGRWIAARNRARKNASVVRRATCRLVLVDRGTGMLGFRCQGTLIDVACRGDDGGATFTGASAWCAGGTLATVGRVSPAPPEPCLESARTALRVPADRFASARADALAACAPSKRTKVGAEPVGEQKLDRGSREMIHRLLARQEALFGPIALPPNGAHLVARGCGNQIWAIQDTNRPGTMGDGGWGGYAHDWFLVRLPAAAAAREPDGSYESMVYFDNTELRGNLLEHSPGSDRKEPPAEADLVEEACVAKHGEPIYCSAYAWGYDPSRLVNALSEDDQKRVAALVASDWPRASRRLARWQVELHSGVRLDTSGGVEVRRTCTRLLLDACTGDLGEVCTEWEADDPSCDGDLLPDGRCRQYDFVRLPLLPAQAPGR